MRDRLIRFFWTLLAAIFLVEAWLWDVVGGLIGAIVAALPIPALRRALRRLIDSMPAIFALALFVVPVLVILPFKLVGLALIAKGRVLLGGGVFLLAKTVGLGVTAFIFDVTRPKLLQLPWFSWLYAHVLTWLARAHALIDPIKNEVRAWWRRELRPVRRRVRRVFWLTRPGRPSHFFERVARIRRRMRVSVPAPSKPAA